jgi:hypothetical protein
MVTSEIESPAEYHRKSYAASRKRTEIYSDMYGIVYLKPYPSRHKFIVIFLVLGKDKDGRIQTENT